MSWNSNSAVVTAVALPAGNLTSCVRVLPVLIVATSIVNAAPPPLPNALSAIVIVSLTACPDPAVTTNTLVTAPLASTAISNVPTVPEAALEPVTS